jgi:hypothetical protein
MKCNDWKARVKALLKRSIKETEEYKKAIIKIKFSFYKSQLTALKI